MFYLVVRAENLSKCYGSKPALQDLTMAVEPGEVFGLLGPTGSGKSTTVRLLLDFIRPTSGRALVLGHDVREHRQELRRQVGFLPEVFSFRGFPTGAAALRYLATLRGGVSWDYVTELSTRLGLDLNRKCAAMSLLEMQKLGLVQAFMHQPELLILDEPGRGLDATAQNTLFSLVAEARREGRSVLFATRSLSDVERVCDRVALLQEGRLLAVERAVRLRGRSVRKVEMRFAGPVSPDVFAGLHNVENVQVDENVIRCIVRGDTESLIKLASQYRVTDILCQQPTLEDGYRRIVNGAGPQYAA